MPVLLDIIFNQPMLADLLVPVWDDILTPLYIDPRVNILYDILTPGSKYRGGQISSHNWIAEKSHWSCILIVYSELDRATHKYMEACYCGKISL